MIEFGASLKEILQRFYENTSLLELVVLYLFLFVVYRVTRKYIYLRGEEEVTKWRINRTLLITATMYYFVDVIYRGSRAIGLVESNVVSHEYLVAFVSLAVVLVILLISLAGKFVEKFSRTIPIEADEIITQENIYEEVRVDRSDSSPYGATSYFTSGITSTQTFKGVGMKSSLTYDNVPTDLLLNFATASILLVHFYSCSVSYLALCVLIAMFVHKNILDFRALYERANEAAQKQMIRLGWSNLSK